MNRRLAKTTVRGLDARDTWPVFAAPEGVVFNGRAHQKTLPLRTEKSRKPEGRSNASP